MKTPTKKTSFLEVKPLVEIEEITNKKNKKTTSLNTKKPMKFENLAPQSQPQKQKLRSKSSKSEPKIAEVLKEKSEINETNLADHQVETKGMCIFIKI